MYNWTGLHGALDRTRGMISMKVSIDSQRISDGVDAAARDGVAIATTSVAGLE